MRCVLLKSVLGSLVFLGAGASGVFAGDKPEDAAFIDNGVVRLGVDLSAGGSVFHFGPSGSEENLLNHYDKGRFIQQSYYGDSDGSEWAGQPWRWNPVQGGGYRGEPAEVLEKELSESQLRIVSIPVHWATGEPVSEARMEASIKLEGPVAHIRFGFHYRGEERHEPRHQELPAVFVDAAYPNLIRYDGDEPWTGDEITRSVPGWPNEGARATENWAAYVNDDDKGIGVFFPGASALTTYRFEGDGTQGPKGSACSYFAPIRTFPITPEMEFNYDVYLTLGSVDTIRERFSEIEQADSPRD